MRPGPFENSYKRNKREQICGSYVVKQFYEKLTHHSETDISGNLFCHVMRREKLEPVTTGVTEEKCSRGIMARKDVDGLTKYLNVGEVTDVYILKATRDRDAWNVLIAYTKGQDTWLIDICTHVKVLDCC